MHSEAPAPRGFRLDTMFPWLVHALTASGAVIAFLALQATLRGDWRLAFQWLALALLVDGIDGPLARWQQVAARTPRFNGATLDLVVDYLTYVFVPTVLIWKMDLVPAHLALAAAAMIQLSSLYHFARTDSKTTDNYFVGFPALWNVVAFYLLVLRLPSSIGMIVVCACAVATFLPVKFVHPVRVRDFRPLIPIAAVVWTVASMALLWPGWSRATSTSLLGVSLGAAAVLVVIGLVRTVRRQDAPLRREPSGTSGKPSPLPPTGSNPPNVEPTSLPQDATSRDRTIF